MRIASLREFGGLKKLGSGGGGMPDSNVRWLINQHTPLPKFVSGQSPYIFIVKQKQVSCLDHKTEADCRYFSIALNHGRILRNYSRLE
jgi:hypothetical protein